MVCVSEEIRGEDCELCCENEPTSYKAAPATGHTTDSRPWTTGLTLGSIIIIIKPIYYMLL